MKKFVLIPILTFLSALCIGGERKFECDVSGSSFYKVLDDKKDENLSGKIILNLNERLNNGKVTYLYMVVNTNNLSFVISTIDSDVENFSNIHNYSLSKKKIKTDEEIFETAKLDRVSGELSYFFHQNIKNSVSITKTYSGFCSELKLQNKF